MEHVKQCLPVTRSLAFMIQYCSKTWGRSWVLCLHALMSAHGNQHGGTSQRYAAHACVETSMRGPPGGMLHMHLFRLIFVLQLKPPISHFMNPGSRM